MTIDELREKIETNEKNGLDQVMLVLPQPKSGRIGCRMRTPFGLAEVVNLNAQGDVVVWVKIEKIRLWMKRVLE